MNRSDCGDRREEFKCELCIFKTDMKKRFERGKKEIH